MSNNDVQGVFDEISSQVVWDDEFLQGVESQDSLLELLAHGECSIGMDNKPIAEPVSFKAPVAGELFDENPVWDDDPRYDTEPPDDMSLDVDHVVEPLTKDFQVLPNVEGSANEMENLTEVIILVLCNDALWDNKVTGLSLFQEFDTEVADVISVPYAFSLDDIFPLRNTDNVQVVHLINQNYCDLAHFGTLVRQHDAIVVGHQMFDDIWKRRAFSPWQSRELYNHLVLIVRFPWRHSGFIPWSSVHKVFMMSTVEHLGNLLQLLPLLPNDHLLRLKEFKGSDAYITAYMQLVCEEIENGMNSHGLLRHIALIADYQVSEERKPTTEQFNSDILTQDSGIHALDLGLNARTTTFNIELGMDVVDTVFDETPPEMFVWAAGFLSDVCATHGLLNGMLYQDVLWDDELLHGIHDPDGLLQQLDPELDDLMQGKQVWDEIPAEIGTHHGLLQQLAQSGDYFDEKKSDDLVSDYDNLDDNLLQDQFVPHSNPDEVSQTSSGKTVGQMELTGCNHPIINHRNGERIITDESMLLKSYSEHNGDVEVDEMVTEVHHNRAGGVWLQPERQTVIKNLKELYFLRQQAAISSQDYTDSGSDQCVLDETQTNPNLSCGMFDATTEDTTSFDECHGNAEVLQIIIDLHKRTEALEKKLIGSDRNIFIEGSS